MSKSLGSRYRAATGPEMTTFSQYADYSPSFAAIPSY
jgi:hypothetical protein